MHLKAIKIHLIWMELVQEFQWLSIGPFWVWGHANIGKCANDHDVNNYRPRQYHFELGIVKIRLEVSDMYVSQSMDPTGTRCDKYLAHKQAHMEQMGRIPSWFKRFHRTYIKRKKSVQSFQSLEPTGSRFHKSLVYKQVIDWTSLFRHFWQVHSKRLTTC